ncbi:MFS transporter [Vibrio albus]|uniref:MFS transporter n=1 Tax=Vibrio albus TaxID=2200953 RepID=A0A2U3BAK5_9VIBR|nr:MFS transporter [Vibrio albus]PWI33826.1 MFS transporter [Vibrio albus]
MLTYLWAHIQRRCTEIICFIIYFLTALDTLIVVPFSASIAVDTGVSASMAGYLTSAYALAAAMTCLVIKGSQNRYREKRRVLFYLSGLMAVTLSTAFISNFYLILVTRFLAGLFGGASTIVTLNYLLLCSEGEAKKKNTAILLSAVPLALALGVPLILLLASAANWRLGFQLLGLALAVITVMFLWQRQPDMSGHLSSNATQKPEGQYPPRKKLLFTSSLVIFVTVLSTFVVSTQYPVMLITNLSIPENTLSLCYMLSGVGSFLIMQSYARRSSGRFSVGKLIGVLSLAMVCSVLIGFHTEDVDLTAVFFALFVIVSSARTLILITEIVSALTTQERVKIIGIQGALRHFAITLGGALSSLLVIAGGNAVLDFSYVVYASVGLTLSTPVLWRINSRLMNKKAQSLEEEDRVGG